MRKDLEPLMLEYKVDMVRRRAGLGWGIVYVSGLSMGCSGGEVRGGAGAER